MLTKNGGGDRKWRLSRVHCICTMHCVQCTLEKQCTANHVIKKCGLKIEQFRDSLLIWKVLIISNVLWSCLSLSKLKSISTYMELDGSIIAIPSLCDNYTMISQSTWMASDFLIIFLLFDCPNFRSPSDVIWYLIHWIWSKLSEMTGCLFD